MPCGGVSGVGLKLQADAAYSGAWQGAANAPSEFSPSPNKQLLEII